MIVKDEAHVVARCLASVRPLLSHWVVVDTGSTDATAQVVEEAMKGLPGELHRRPWRGFGPSRTEALELARGKADYALVIDADDVLVFGDDFELPPLDLDVYSLEVRLAELQYRRPQLFRLAKPWRYLGVLHEYATCDEPTRAGTLEGVTYVCNRDGARSTDPDKYRRDAEQLEAALEDEPENARYMFYAAQSWRDAGNDRRARELYLRRVTMTGFVEEVFIAHLEAAKCTERLGDPVDAVTGAYLRAYASRPSRAEPLYELARYCRLRGDHALAWLFSSAAMAVPRPNDTLFVASDVYTWRIRDEHALAAYYTARYEVAKRMTDELLSDPALPETERRRLLENLIFCMSALAKAAPSPRRPSE
jgi:glycosyltransferase involved in cell wall biosynthesis